MPPSRQLLAALLLLELGAAPLQAGAQVTSAHEDSEWEADRQTPYAGAGWLESEGGSPALLFPRSGVILRSWLPLADFGSPASANDIWGYVSPSGREYALIGLRSGTGFVEVTDPANATLVATLAGPPSDWRDIKTYQEYAYAVSEGGGGIQVFDLSQIDAGIVNLANTVTTGGRSATHDVALNTDSGRLYRVGGGGSPVLGLRIYSLADPSLPVFEGEWNDRYCHDAQVVSWTEAPYAGGEVAFCFANDTATSGNPGVEILDVSDPANVSVIGSINLALPPIFSHPAQYSHQGWLSPDRHYLYFNDEVDEAVFGNSTTTRVIDVSDLSNPLQIAIFSNGNEARDHNLYTLEDLIFEANYRSGLRVFDASDALAPVEVGFFDTYPPDNEPHYNGLWGIYPYLPSGTVIGSDIEKGLFVWTLGQDVPSSTIPTKLVGLIAIATVAGLVLRKREGVPSTANMARGERP